MSSQAPIGIFDSGVGGLTVAREIRELLPHEDLRYFSDNANCPYGDRTSEEVTVLSAAATEQLLDLGAKLIVVACNSASGAALTELRRRYDVPFVGMVPAIKPACALSGSGRVGVLATTVTVQADLFSDVVSRFARDCRLTIQTCPGLAEAIEHGELDTPETSALLAGYLRALKAAQVDVVVLGCTHYPLLRPAIEREMGPGVRVVDSGAAVASQVRRVLHERGLLAERPGPGTFHLSGSGDIAVARRLAGETRLLNPLLSSR
ncbi:MAG: glutamate racemase [Dehalococcoidia bacterium]